MDKDNGASEEMSKCPATEMDILEFIASRHHISLDDDGAAAISGTAATITMSPKASFLYFLLVIISCGVIHDQVHAFATHRVHSFVRTSRGAHSESNAAEDALPGAQEPLIDGDSSSGSKVTLSELSYSVNEASSSSQITDFARDLRRLSILRPAIPHADFSAPLEMVSAGSSYTRIWNAETWKRHTLSYPHERYIRHLKRWRYSTTAQKVFPAALFSAAWAFVVCIIVKASPGSMLVQASKGVFAALGPLSAPIALLLTLRTNAALGRLNEARVAWGRLVLHARSYAALLRSYILPYYPEAAILSAKHVAIFGWLLKSAVRGEDRAKQLEVMEAVLGKESRDYQWLASCPKPVWAITIRLRQIVAAVANKYPGNMFVAHNLLEEGIANMEGVAGVCERILGSPIPPTYSRHLSRVLSIWLAMLPVGLIGSGVPTLGVVISSSFTTYVLVGLDEIGMEIENCFSLLPLQQIAGAVQSGVSMQLIDNECCDGSIPDLIEYEMPDVPLA